MMLRMTWLLLALAATINVCPCAGDTHNMDLLDTVDSVDTVDTVDTVKMVDTVDTNIVVENYLEKFVYAKMRLRRVYWIVSFQP